MKGSHLLLNPSTEHHGAQIIDMDKNKRPVQSFEELSHHLSQRASRSALYHAKRKYARLAGDTPNDEESVQTKALSSPRGRTTRIPAAAMPPDKNTTDDALDDVERRDCSSGMAHSCNIKHVSI